MKMKNKILRNLSFSLFSLPLLISVWRYLVQKQNFTTIYTTSKPQVFDQELFAIVSVKMLCNAAIENLSRLKFSKTAGNHYILNAVYYAQIKVH